MSEFEAMAKIDVLLSELGDDERNRVLQWAYAKYALRSGNAIASPSQGAHLPAMRGAPIGNEIPGIATLTPGGEFKFTVRDVKAKNANDAAIRIAHIAIWAYKQLTNEQAASSKRIVVPILKTWRAYSGNTRHALSSHKGILREGDSLSLDAHSMNEAKRYVDEVLDDSIQGTWTPRPMSKKKRVGGAE